MERTINRQKAPTELERRLAEEAAAFSGAYRRWMDSSCEGLSYVRLRALEALHCQGPLMMRFIGEYLGLSPRNMTALVDSLEKEGLVVRKPHPQDRRAFLVQATDKGEEVGAKAFQQRIAAISELFEELSPEQQEGLLETLSVLRLALRRRGLRA